MPDPAPAPKMLLPWFRESAFLAWIDKTGAAFAAALVALVADVGSIRENWQLALLAPLILSVADFLLSIRAIFFAGPVTYQDPPPPKPAADPLEGLSSIEISQLRALLRAQPKTIDAPSAP